MKKSRNPTRHVLAVSCALALSHSALGLDILLTNDDGYNSPGITALRDALMDAGHNVTVVGPATQQSGKGGSINTNVFNFQPGVGLMQLKNWGDGVWSLAGSPVDALKAGLDIVLKDNPPDLIVSGLNEGENIGKPGSNASGTEGAALQGVFRGIPSIAASVQVLFSESGTDPRFVSTVEAYEPAAEFVARTIAKLEAKNGAAVLPKHIRMLNINFPVPYSEIKGAMVTSLADGSGLELPLFDPNQGFPSFGVPAIPNFPSCAIAATTPGASCFAGVGLAFSPTPDAVKKSDLDALEQGYITITPYDADMTGLKTELEGVVTKLAP